MKLTRTKILIEKIESEIERNQRRIATIADNNFKLRKQLEALKALPEQKPLTKADLLTRDEKSKAGKFYDAAYHEQQREEKLKAEDAAKAATEAVTDSADQEIGAPVEGAI